MWESLWLSSPRDFHSQSCLHWASNNLLISYSCTGSHRDFCLWVSASVSFVLYSPVCLSNIWYSGLPCDLTSLNRFRKCCWFFSLISFILGRTEWWLLRSLHVVPETELTKGTLSLHKSVNIWVGRLRHCLALRR